nr:pyridoxal phosphate-dependent aminotransferase [Actinomycetota bacterium]
REDELVRIAGALKRDRARRLALVVVNAQHNPTGVDWGEPFVEQLVEVAETAGAALLIDDAHFALHKPGDTPTSAVRIVCRRSREGEIPWLATRSLGKDFSCNGWALGALAAEPPVLDSLVGELLQERQYNCAGALQWAMADWLEQGGPEGYLDQRRWELDEKRTYATTALVDELEYPATAVHAGPSSPFALFELPPAYAGDDDGNQRFRHDCFRATGVILSDAWPLARDARHGGTLPYVRMFLGPPVEALTDAIRRLRRAGIRYGMARL